MTYTFLYYTQPNHRQTFRSEMESHQCQFIKRNQQQCKNRCIIGFEYCHSHMKTVLGLKIAPSTIPEAGKGLFAMKQFERDEKICDYHGELLTREEVHDRYTNPQTNRTYTAPYTVAINNNYAVDSATERGIGSLANTSAGHNNARLVVNQRARTVSIKASRRIPIGQEIFVAYGPGYRHPTATTYDYTTVPYRRVY
jgi:hypothetical protein